MEKVAGLVASDDASRARCRPWISRFLSQSFLFYNDALPLTAPSLKRAVAMWGAVAGGPRPDLAVPAFIGHAVDPPFGSRHSSSCRFYR